MRFCVFCCFLVCFLGCWLLFLLLFVVFVGEGGGWGVGVRVFKDVLKPLNRFMFRKEGNVLFNDPLNTFYVRIYGIRH